MAGVICLIKRFSILPILSIHQLKSLQQESSALGNPQSASLTAPL